MGFFVSVTSLCSADAFCGVGFLSSPGVPWNQLPLLMPPSRVRCQCGHTTSLSYYLLKLNLTPLVLDFRQKFKEIICSKISFLSFSMAQTSTARILYARRYFWRTCSFWPLRFDMFLRNVDRQLSILEVLLQRPVCIFSLTVLVLVL